MVPGTAGTGSVFVPCCVHPLPLRALPGSSSGHFLPPGPSQPECSGGAMKPRAVIKTFSFSRGLGEGGVLLLSGQCHSSVC